MAGLKVAAHTFGLALFIASVARCGSSDGPGASNPSPEGGTGGTSAGGGGLGQSGGSPGSSGAEATGGSGNSPPTDTGGSGNADASAGLDAGRDANADAGITTCQREVFLTAPRVSLPDSPVATLSADVDGDGDPDAVVLHRESDAEHFESWVRVLFNQGDGTFRAGDRNDVQGSARAIASGDVDGDGTPDLVVAHGEVEGVPESVDVVSVLLNTGGGNFDQARTYSAGKAQRSVALGDLDGDDWLDIVVTNHASGELRILYNQGDGTFAAPVPVAVAPSPEAAVIADLDGDQKADIAVTDRAAAARVLLNLGSRTFAAPVSYGAAPDPLLAAAYDSVAAIDFNGDQRPDLLVARNARVLMNQGNGTFAAPVTLAAAPGGDGFPADFDGDGKTDVGLAGPEGVAIRFSNGDGTFSARSDRAHPLSTACLPVAADVDGDGDTDVLGADLFAEEAPLNPAFPDGGRRPTVVSGTLTLALNAGDGSFFGETNTVVRGGAHGIAAADLNGDGRVDLATAAHTKPNGAGFVAYALHEGAGVMSAPVLLASGGLAPSAVGIGDLNADGRPDLTVCNAGTDAAPSNVGVLLASAAGGFAPVKVLDGVPGTTRVFHGRFDADPRPDLLASGEQDTYLIANLGDGNFAPPVRVEIPNVMHVADFDGDGDTDLVATVGTWAVHVRMNRGDGTFEEPISVAVFWRPNWRTFAVSSGDFDGDGNPDVLVSSGLGDILTDPDSTGTIFEDAQLSVFPSRGDGTFGEPFVSTPTLPRNARPTTIASGDFDGDGHLDVVAGAGASTRPGAAPSAYVFINRGDNTFFEPVPWGSRNETTALVTARLNDDDADDLVLASGSSLAVFLTRDCRE